MICPIHGQKVGRFCDECSALLIPDTATRIEPPYEVGSNTDICHCGCELNHGHQK